MNNRLYRFFTLVLVLGFFSNWAFCQNHGSVPELVDVPKAKVLVSAEIKNIEGEIINIQKLGGIVGIELQNKEILFKAVSADLESNLTGMTTYLAVVNQSNYLNIWPDALALNDLLAGKWDKNINSLITLLKK